MVSKQDLYKKEEKGLLQSLVKKLASSLYGGNFRRDVNDQFKCVTDNWMNENYDDRVKDCWRLRNINLAVELEDDSGVDDRDIAKLSIQIPCHPGSYIFGHFKRLLNIVVWEKDACYCLLQ